MKMVIQGSRRACDLEVDGEDLKHTGNHAAILATNPAKESLANSFRLFWYDRHDIRHWSPLPEHHTRPRSRSEGARASCVFVGSTGVDISSLPSSGQPLKPWRRRPNSPLGLSGMTRGSVHEFLPVVQASIHDDRLDPSNGADVLGDVPLNDDKIRQRPRSNRSPIRGSEHFGCPP